MKKSIILKSFLVILVCAMLVFTATSVYAATDEGFNDLLSDGNNTSSGTNTNTGNSNTNTNTGTNTNTNTNTNTKTNRNSSNVQNINALRNNTSNTTNTNLPNTGIQDALPTVLLVVVFGISAIYAYKKIKDYRNID